MTRYLCCLAVFGVAALPDWATAYHRCWAPPPPCGPGPAYPPQFYFIPPVAPVYEVPLPPPVVFAAPPAARPAPPAARAADPAPVRPAAATAPAPLPPVVPPVPPLVPTFKAAEPPIPPLVLPDPPAAAPLPKVEPQVPPLVLPDPPGLPAIPTPAPPPDAAPKRPAEVIPPLVLPPDTPAGPTGVIPPTTSRSSPLAAAPRVQVFPVAGAAAAGGRRVGFFNHTGRDIALTIEGRPVTLPAKSFLHAELPPTFRWSEAGGPARTTTVPADSPGVDVLFRAGE